MKKQAFAKAIEIIGKRSRNDQLRLAEHEAKIAEKLPQAYRMKKQLALTAAQLGRAIFTSDECKAHEKINEIKKHNQEIQEKIANALLEAGYPKDYLSLTYECGCCKDTGFVNGEKCECLKKLEAEFLAERLCERCDLDGSRFDNFLLTYYCDEAQGSKLSPRGVMKKIYDYCRHYAENFTEHSDSVLLFGGTGLGKTHLSLAIAGEVVKKGYEVLYGSAQDFLRKIEDEHFGRAEEGSDTLGEILDSQLVIIDDLGVEFCSDFNVSVVHDIINSRLSLKKPTIINTNLSAADIEKKYSARIVSRLFSGYVCLRCEGSDVRIIKAQNLRG